MSKKIPPLFTCSICHADWHGYGNNAQPINNGRCCDECNMLVVIPARIALIYGGKNPYEVPQR